jgi:hypothetical protein
MFALLVSVGLVHAMWKISEAPDRARWVVFSRDENDKTWVLLLRARTGSDGPNDTMFVVPSIMPRRFKYVFSWKGFRAGMQHIVASARLMQARIKCFALRSSENVDRKVAREIQKEESVWVLYEIPMWQLLELGEKYSADQQNNDFAVCNYETLTHTKISPGNLRVWARLLFHDMYDAYRTLMPYGANPPHVHGRVPTHPAAIYMIGKLLGLPRPPPVAPLLAYEVDDEDSVRENISHKAFQHNLWRSLAHPFAPICILCCLLNSENEEGF